MTSGRSVTIYEISLISIVLAWFFNQSGVFPRLVPRVVLSGVDYGFYVAHIVLFLTVWFVVYFVERNLGTPIWLNGARSNQGTAKVIDGLVIFACFYCLSVAYGADVLWQSPYLIALLVIAVLAAMQSLIIGRERYQHQGVIDLSGVAEDEDGAIHAAVEEQEFELLDEEFEEPSPNTSE